MRTVVLAALLTGCGFAGAPGSPGDDDPEPTADDATSDDGEPAAISAFCDDPRVVLCLEFDEILTEGVIRDGTALAQTVIAELVRGRVRGTSGVVEVDGSSVLEVEAAPSLDVREGFTVEAWGNLGALPANRPGGGDDSATLVGADGQFELTIMHDGNVKCVVGDQEVKAGPGRVAAGVWHHYACTWDGFELALFIDGAEAKRVERLSLGFDDLPGDILIGAELDDGERDDPFIGAIDNVRVFMEALPPAEICPGGCQ